MRLAAFLFMFLFVSISFAQESAAPTVDELSVCTAVEDRQPVGVNTEFSSDVGTLYCFTKVSGAAADSSISHVWYYNDKEMARVKLNVGADAWRTWSSKKIVEEWVGNWRVDVESAAGSVLKSQAFTISAPQAQAQ